MGALTVSVHSLVSTESEMEYACILTYLVIIYRVINTNAQQHRIQIILTCFQTLPYVRSSTSSSLMHGVRSVGVFNKVWCFTWLLLYTGCRDPLAHQGKSLSRVLLKLFTSRSRHLHMTWERSIIRLFHPSSTCGPEGWFCSTLGDVPKGHYRMPHYKDVSILTSMG